MRDENLGNAMKIIRIQLTIVLALLALFGARAASSQESNFTTGTLDGVHLKIAREYQFFPVAYEGVDIWQPASSDESHVKTGVFASFSLRLQFPDFTPFKEDKLGSVGVYPSSENQDRWMTVHVGHRPTVGQVSERAWLRNYVARLKEYHWSSNGVIWTYRRDGMAFGLMREVMVGPDFSVIDFRNKALYFDAELPTVYITCLNGAVAKDGVKECTENFLMPGTFWFVQVTFNDRHLSEWKAIKEHVIDRIDSFIVH